MLAALLGAAGTGQAGPVARAAHGVPALGAADKVWLLGKARDAAPLPVRPAPANTALPSAVAVEPASALH